MQIAETTTLIKVECTDQVLRLTQTPTIASGGVKEDTVEFAFDNLWDGFNLAAVFYCSEKEVYHVGIVDNRCIVPREVLANPGYFYLSVMGVKDGVTRTTNVLSYRVEAGAITEGVKPPEPTPSIYEQILASVKYAEQIAQSVRDDADAGKFDGAKGDKGDKGDKGADGSDATVTAQNIEAALGYAPVTPSDLAAKQDVLTDADRQSITKTGMTTGAAWTNAEQKAARERMGVDKAYELIEEITLAEESRVARSTEPDGTPYNFAVIMLRAEFPASEKTGNIYVLYNIGNLSNAVTSYFLSPYNANAVKYGYSKAWEENGRYRSGWWSCVENHGQFASYYENPVQQDKYSVADGNIVSFSTDVMAAGTKVSIYGVRA